MSKARVVAVLAALICIAGCGEGISQQGYTLATLVPGGSPFHGVHGLRFDENDQLYAVSVIGQSVFTVDTETGDIETVVGPPQGMGDDLAFAADGTMVWTAIEDGIVYARAPDGAIRRLMENRRGVNAVSFSPDGQRLFVTLVFYGDALYELDLDGASPPRLIAEGLGGLNAFEVADDDMIYGPLVFGGRVVRIDPDTGATSTVSDDFVSPGALKLDLDGSALVLDDGLELKRVDLASGRTDTVATLPFGADNLAIDSSGRVFVSLSEVNAIVEVDTVTGDVRYVVDPAPLNSPTGLAVSTGDTGDTLYLGDLFGGVRVIDGQTGAIEDTPVDIFQPAHVSVAADTLLVVGQVFGAIQLLDRSSFEVLDAWEGFDSPGDALSAPNGDVIVAETGSGRLLRVSGPEASDRSVIVAGLRGPNGLAWAGEGAVYVTETGGGDLLRVDLNSSETSPVAMGLQQPEGVAVDSDGAIIVVEVGAQRLTRIDPSNGSQSIIAADLPIGFSNGPSLYRGVAASPSAIYFNSDVENTVFRLVRQ